MKRNHLLVSVIVLAAVQVLAACGGSNSSPVDSAKELPKSQQRLVELAKKEGEVVIGAGGHTRAQVELLAKEFEKKYDINVTFVRENSSKIAQQVQSQQAAGSTEFDVISLNNEATLQLWAKEQILADPALPNSDQVMRKLVATPGQPYLPFTWQAMGYVYNSAKLDPASAPTTWKALAAQQAVFAVADPRSSGAGFTFVAAMQQQRPGFLKSVGGHKVLLSDSALALTQLVTTGEAKYGLPGLEAGVAAARKAGEPLKIGYPKGPIGALPSFTAALSKAPHPAAARLLTQFQLSKGFQQALTRSGSRSVLRNVPPPKGLPVLGGDRLVILDAAKVKANKKAILTRFTRTVGGRG